MQKGNLLRRYSRKAKDWDVRADQRDGKRAAKRRLRKAERQACKKMS